jgi:acetyltransferase-like isoleucine patch superfamily enzyme
MQTYVDKSKNIEIKAADILIGNKVSFGSNIRVAVKGVFQIGDFSRLGGDTEILGGDIRIGTHLFHSSGLRIGGGGRQNPNACLTIGDRCTIHNNFINVCEPVVIGNDVGLSPDTSILTHGYWLSVLEGFPARFAGVRIGNGIIVGYRSLIMMGTEIVDECVVGAQSVVSKSLKEKGIYAGAPARFIKKITPLSIEERVRKVEEILRDYAPIAEYHDIALNGKMRLDYPWLHFKDLVINLETFEYQGSEDEETDDLRDYLRKWGIRVYTERGFTSKFKL